MKRLLLFSLVICLCFSRSYGQWGVDSDSKNFRPSTNVSFTSSSLPLVFITVDGKVIQKESKILGTMKVINNSDGKNYTDLTAYPNQKVDWEGPITIKYRGNSSFYNSKKKPFAVRPLTEASLTAKKAKVALMGMGKDNDWALLAPWEDKSYMRDVLTMELARGGNSFAPHMKYCEVFVDGYYYGVYILSERATKGKQRLNLDDPTADDLTGDFHVEIDRDDEDHYYTSKYHPVRSDGTEISSKYITYQYKEPEYDDFSDLPTGVEQAIQTEINNMEDAFAASNYTDETSGYRKYIDVASFIDFEIAQELSNNIDGYRLSSPLYKYSQTHAAELGTDSKWKTALWDFNIAYGNASYYSPNSNIWRYNANDIMESADDQLIPFFWYKLMKDEKYVDELKQRWSELRQGRYSDAYIESKIDSLGQVLTASGALDRDNKAWSSQFGTFTSQVSTLKSFIKSRLKFMDKGWIDTDVIGKQYSPLSIANGYNYDVIAESLPPASYTSGALDGAGWAFYTADVQTTGAIADASAIVKAESGISYKLGAFDKNNALVLGSSNSGKLTFDSPVCAKKLTYLATSADGSSSVTVTANYSDGSSYTANASSIDDWYASSASGDEAVYGLGRINGKSTSSNLSSIVDSRMKFRLFEASIDVDSTKKVASLSFASTGGTPTILAVSGILAATTGITGLPSTSDKPAAVAIYGIDGSQRNDCQKGINIIKYSDGNVKKVYVK